MDRYTEASELLKTSINAREDRRDISELSDLAGELEHCSSSQFGQMVNAILEKQKFVIKDQTIWGKCEHAIQYVFAAFSPFAKNFLRIATESQSVHRFP
jgi:uncharacterized protein (DUF1778 family)